MLTVLQVMAMLAATTVDVSMGSCRLQYLTAMKLGHIKFPVGETTMSDKSLRVPQSICFLSGKVQLLSPCEQLDKPNELNYASVLE